MSFFPGRKFWLFALFALLLALAAAGFWPDEPLTAETALFLKPMPVKAEGNAYAALFGLQAPAGQDFQQSGAAWLEETRRLTLKDAETFRQPDEWTTLTFQGKPLENCDSEGVIACAERFAAAALRAKEARTENKELLERYQALRQMPLFEVPSPLQIYPNYQTAIRLSRLLWAEAVGKIEKGEAAEGLRDFAEDAAFYRRILAADSAGLVEVMIACAALRQQHKLLSGLMASGRLNPAANAAALRALLAPTPPPAEIFARAMRAESRYILWTIAQIELTAEDGIKARILHWCCFRKNMTLNALARFQTRLIENALAMPPKRVPEAYQTLGSDSFPENDSGFFFWRNNVGKILAEIGIDRYDDYLARMYDDSAYAAYVRAQLEYLLAARGQKNEQNTAQILAGLAPETFNPYAGAPFAWDEQSRKLIFTPAYDKRNYFLDVAVSL